MKVILLQDVKNISRKDEVVDVAEEYARNFLIPRAWPWRPRAPTEQHEQRRAKLPISRPGEAEARGRGQAGPRTLVIKVKAGEGGRLFGSVTSGDIAEHVEKLGVRVDKRRIELDEPLKTVGAHGDGAAVPGVQAQLKVDLVEDK